MVTEQRSLREHLDRIADATGMRLAMQSEETAAAAEFRQAIADDRVLAERARAMLDSMDERVLMRDHVSRWTKATLERALGDAP